MRTEKKKTEVLYVKEVYGTSIKCVGKIIMGRILMPNYRKILKEYIH